LKDKIGSTRLSFASPGRLLNVLKLTPGSVNPFSLMNDEEHKVKLFVDKDILNGENLNFHPNINTKMVNLPLDGFEKFLVSENITPIPRVVVNIIAEIPSNNAFVKRV